MMKKWIAINLLLLAAAALIGWQLRASILRFNADNDVGKIVPVQNMKQLIVPEKPASKAVPAKTYNPADFGVIAEKNLFSDTRTKEEKVEAAAPPEPPPLTQKPILVGIAIMDNRKEASIIDPAGPQGRGAPTAANRAQIKKIGDSYQGYIITDIFPDHIVLESGSRKESIPLHEGTKRVSGGKTPIIATRVVSFGAGGAAGSATVVAGSAGAPVPVRTAVAPTSIPAAPQTSQPPPAARGVTVAPAPKAHPAPAGSGSGTSAPPGTRTIRTPFGDYTRPAR